MVVDDAGLAELCPIVVWECSLLLHKRAIARGRSCPESALTPALGAVDAVLAGRQDRRRRHRRPADEDGIPPTMADDADVVVVGGGLAGRRGPARPGAA